MGTRNAEERRKAAGKHRKESFSVKLEVVAKYEPQENKNPTHPHHSSADESGSSFYQSEIRSKCLAHNHFN